MAVLLAFTSFVMTGCNSNNGTKADETTVADITGNDTASVEVYDMKSPIFGDMDLTQYVKIGEINGIVVSSFTTEVSEDEINKELELLRQEAATVREVTDRPLALGDTATLDYAGKMDDETITSSNMSATDAQLEIGSGRFIPGFEDGMIGMNIGETRDIHVVFPDPYNNNPDLSGKPATFVVTLKSFTETVIPELDDYFAASVSDFDTLDELKAQIKADLAADKEAAGLSNQQEEVWTAIMESSEFIEEPVALVDEYLADAVSYYQDMADYNGFASLDEMLMEYYGITLEQFTAEMREYAKDACLEEMVLVLVAQKAGVVLTNQEYQEGALKLAGEVGVFTVEMLEERYGADVIYNSLLFEEVIDYLIANAVVE